MFMCIHKTRVKPMAMSTVQSETVVAVTRMKMQRKEKKRKKEAAKTFA